MRGQEDLDLFVAYDTGGGHFQVVGSSTGPAGSKESVTLVAPAAGTYEVWVGRFDAGRNLIEVPPQPVRIRVGGTASGDGSAAGLSAGLKVAVTDCHIMACQSKA